MPHPHTDTTRPIKRQENNQGFNFVTEEAMRKDIMAHKFIEFGKHEQHLYGIKAEAVMEVIDANRICVLDVHPQVSGWGSGESGWWSRVRRVGQ